MWYYSEMDGMGWEGMGIVLLELVGWELDMAVVGGWCGGFGLLWGGVWSEVWGWGVGGGGRMLDVWWM